MNDEQLFKLALTGLVDEERKRQLKDLDGNPIDHASLFEEITRIGMKTLNGVMVSKGFSDEKRLVELTRYALISKNNYYQILASKGILFEDQKN